MDNGDRTGKSVPHRRIEAEIDPTKKGPEAGGDSLTSNIGTRAGR